MAEEQARWYVIHTYSGYEAMVKDSLEKLIENNNLQENIFEIQIPTEETLEEKANGKKKLVERKKFPCYVFLKMKYNNNLWYLITSTRGVTGFVGPQGRPLPLTPEEVARMGIDNHQKIEVDFKVGDEVQIVSGVLESFIGKVISRFSSRGIPVIAGGLIESKAEITEALSSGASAVSTGKKELWYV